MKAVIYARISRDRAGAGLGVERQESDCRELAVRAAHDVVEVITDNDLTAYKAAHRPGFEKLISLLDSGNLDVLLAWHTDRIYRDNVDLERLIDVCDRRNIPVLTVKAGALDLSTASGRMAARIYCAVQKHEVEHAIERMKSAKLQAAQAGKFSGGQRPFGYEKGCVAVREDEAVIYKQMVAYVLDGWSFNRVANHLNRSDVRTQHGKVWNALKVRNLLLHARYAGIREHNGVHYPAVWPAIIGKETWDDLQLAIKMHAARYKQGGPGRRRKFLLTGLIHCGVCGKRMNTAPDGRRDGKKVSRYVCRKQDSGNGPGCGKTARLIDPVDLLVSESIIYRLESLEFSRALLTRDSSTDDLRDLVRRRAAQSDRVEEIRNDYANGELTKSEYQSLIQTAQGRLEELTRQVEQSTPSVPNAKLPPAHLAREVWQAATLEQQRTIAELLIQRVDVMPSDTRGLQKGQYFHGYKFDPSRITIHWTL